MKKIKFMAKPCNGMIAIPKKYQKNMGIKIQVTVEFEEPKKAKTTAVKAKTKAYSNTKLQKIIKETIKEYDSVLKKLSKE